MRAITFQDVLTTQTTSISKIGQRAVTPDGREWVYVKASAAFSKGHVVVPAAVTHVDTVSSSTNGAGQIVFITEASAGWTVGAFQEAWICVADGTGAGQVAKVKDNTTDTLELYPEYALGTALAVADSDIDIWTDSLVRKAVVTTKVQNAVGIAQVDFASGDYGYVLTRGLGVVIAGEALVVGKSFVTGDDTAGEVVKGTTAKGGFDEQILGVCVTANASADKGALVFVELS